MYMSERGKKNLPYSRRPTSNNYVRNNTINTQKKTLNNNQSKDRFMKNSMLKLVGRVSLVAQW